MNKIEVRDITDKNDWDKFTLSIPEANFLASWNWGLFHQKLGKKAYFRGYFQNSRLVGTALFVKETAKRGNYLTIAGGPLLDWRNNQLIKSWVNDCKSLARAEVCLFVRVRPQLKNTPEHYNIFREKKFNLAPMHLTADLTLQLDLGKSTNTLLAEMRKNTRYEIRKALKLGIKVETTDDVSLIDEFYQHQVALAHKHNFVPFSHEFLKTQFEVFAQDNQVLLFNAYHKDTLLASAFVILYGNEAVYHYGISTPANNRLPGSYACQWAAIQAAQKRGLTRYNFWGITPRNSDKNHRFAGVSLFKRGFGGEEYEHVPAMDLPISTRYPLVYLFEKLRAKKRHLV